MPLKILMVTTFTTGLTAAALLIAGALTPAALQGQTALRSLSNPTSTATVNLSSTTFSTFRTEFRIENISSNASTRYIWGLGAFPTYFCYITANTLILSCQFSGEGTPSGVAEVDLTGKSDVRVRWQRDPAARTYQMETWNGDCTGYVSITKPITSALSPLRYSGPAKIGDKMQLAFLRMSSTLDTSEDCPIDAPDDETGNILDFRFETEAGVGTLIDVSNHAYRINAKGPSFAASTTYAPQAVIRGLSTSLKPVTRTAQPFTLDGSTSVVFAGHGHPSTYLWQQTAGPAPSVLSAPTASATQITPPVAGQYSYRLTVGDGLGNTGVREITVGVVTTDDTYVAEQSNAAHNWVLGRVVMHGKSPWPWYEITEAADVDVLAPVMSTPPTEVAGAGTLRASAPPNKIDASGQLTSEGTGRAGIIWTGVGTHFTAADVGKRLSIHWDADDNNSDRGRRVVYISAVNSPTEIVASDYYMTEPPAEFSSGLAWGTLGVDYYPYNSIDGASQIAMFYEAGLAVGRLYAKTGLTTYRTQFHTFCNNWWRWGLGSGWAYPIPRNSGLHTMLACATDPGYTAPPGLWDGLARITRLMAGRVPTSTGAEVGYNPTSTVVKGIPDIREMSYVLRATALLARTYGAHGGSTAVWCGYLANQVTTVWLGTAVVPVGAPSRNYAFWEENLFLSNVGYVAASHPAADPAGHFGTSPWRSAGLPALALIYAYDALRDPATCNNVALADQLFDPADGSGLIAKVANYIWDYGRSADGGLLYAEGYETDTGNRVGGTVFNSFPWIGTLSVTNGSPNVVGSGTLLTKQFGVCDGTTQIRIRGTTYAVRACADDTHLTLSTNYAGSTESGVSDYRNPSTIAVTNGSTGVIGTGTKFQTLYAPCDGTTYIGIVGNARPTVDRRVYQVTACADNTHLTLNRPYAGPSETGLNVFSRAVRAEGNCAPAITKYCEPDRYSGRNLAADVAASAAWLYAKTGNITWSNRAKYYANKTFGGPAGGAGSIGPPTGSCVGDKASDCADGGHGNLGEILPACGTNPTPCGDGALVPKYGKPLGMASGAGDTPLMLANLLGRRR